MVSWEFVLLHCQLLSWYFHFLFEMLPNSEFRLRSFDLERIFVFCQESRYKITQKKTLSNWPWNKTNSQLTTVSKQDLHLRVSLWAFFSCGLMKCHSWKCVIIGRRNCHITVSGLFNILHSLGSFFNAVENSRKSKKFPEFLEKFPEPNWCKTNHCAHANLHFEANFKASKEWFVLAQCEERRKFVSYDN